MPSIDVVVPNYRYGHYLRECVESVLAQGLPALRVLIVDNASDDDSPAVARALAAEDSRVRLCLRGRNLGPHASFNAGIDWAEADYLLILCSDDLLAPGSLAWAVAALEAHPEASVALGAEEAQVREGQAMPDLSRSAQRIAWRLQSGENFIGAAHRRPMHLPCAGSMVVRTAAQKRVGHYRAGLHLYDDFEVLLRLATLGPVLLSEGFMTIRRVHGGNISSHFWRRRLDMLTELEDAFSSFSRHEGAALPGAAKLLRLARSRLGDAAYWAAVSALVRGRSGEAAELLRYAYSRSPWSLVLPPVPHLWRVPDATARIRATLGAVASRAR